MEEDEEMYCWCTQVESGGGGDLLLEEGEMCCSWCTKVGRRCILLVYSSLERRRCTAGVLKCWMSRCTAGVPKWRKRLCTAGELMWRRICTAM